MGLSKQLSMDYLERGINVVYHEEDNVIYLESINYEGRDITGLVSQEKVFADMPEAMYQQTVTDSERNLDL